MKKIISIILVTCMFVSGAVFAAASTVNINSASVEMLAETLSGIGLKKAQKIVAYRKANGLFVQVDDLTKVKGIGVKTLELNRSKILISVPES